MDEFGCGRGTAATSSHQSMKEATLMESQTTDAKLRAAEMDQPGRSQRDRLRTKVKKSGEMEAEFRIVHRRGSSIGDLLVFLFGRRKRPPNFRSAAKRPGTLCPLVCAMPRNERPAPGKGPSETGWLILPAIAAERRGGNRRKCAKDNIGGARHYASVSTRSQRG